MASIIFLTILISLMPRFTAGEEIPFETYTDPPNDLKYIYLGTPVPPEEYVGYLDVIEYEAELTLTSIDFRITLNEGIPVLKYGTSWTILLDRNNDPTDNCPWMAGSQYHPLRGSDTMYSVIYDSSTGEWRIERAIYKQWNWHMIPTDATWAMMSSWPAGKLQILVSIPMYEMPEILPETLPWKILTECVATTKGDFAPDEGRCYTPLYFEERMFIEGVFQPVQVVYQQDPIWGDNMTRISSHEWTANLPMVQDKNTLLFGYPYDDRYVMHFNVTNSYSVSKTFNLTFWVENRKIYETGPFTSEPFATIRINLTAPLPRNNSAPTPFKFENKGNSTIEVEVHPVPNSEPILCNKVTVHAIIKRTQALDLLYVPILLFNGTTGARLHDPVTYAEAKEHASKATDFIRGTYPLAEDSINYEVAWPPFAINHTEVQAGFNNPPWNLKINLYKVHQKLTHYLAVNYPGYTRVVALIPDGALSWSQTYHYGRNATHIWHYRWKGCTYGNASNVVFVTSGWWGTTAHEIGHTFNLKWGVTGRAEEYNGTYSGDRAPGYWVNENEDQPVNTICFMGNVNSYEDISTWICKPDYYYLLTQRFNASDPEVLLVNGLISKNGTVELGSWYRLSAGVPDIALGTNGSFSLVFLDKLGRILGQAGFNIQFLLLGDEPTEIDLTCFAFTIPFIPGTARIQIVFNGVVVSERVVTANSPTVTISYPNGGEILNPRVPCTVTWNASDADGDALTYILEYSSNSGLTWTLITQDTHVLSYRWNASELDPGGCYMIRIIATDGLNMGEDSSDNTFFITFKEDINCDGTVNIIDISMVANAFGSNVGDPRWNPEADMDRNGKINIIDISTIAAKFGKSL
jgi:hypothetical protein